MKKKNRAKAKTISKAKTKVMAKNKVAKNNNVRVKFGFLNWFKKALNVRV